MKFVFILLMHWHRYSSGGRCSISAYGKSKPVNLIKLNHDMLINEVYMLMENGNADFFQALWVGFAYLSRWTQHRWQVRESAAAPNAKQPQWFLYSVRGAA